MPILIWNTLRNPRMSLYYESIYSERKIEREGGGEGRERDGIRLIRNRLIKAEQQRINFGKISALFPWFGREPTRGWTLQKIGRVLV